MSTVAGCKQRGAANVCLKTCVIESLVKKVFVVNVHKDTNNDTLLNEFRDIFEGMGCLPGEHKIHIDHQMAPVTHACRKVPFALRELKKLGSKIQEFSCSSNVSVTDVTLVP